jgi:hypothetical protein
VRHDVSRFDIPVDEFLFVNGLQAGSDLGNNLECQLHLEATGSLNEFFECFSVYELHRIKVVFTGSTQVEDRGYIRVTDAPLHGLRAESGVAPIDRRGIAR